jgi:hypothetical protein
MIMIRKRVEGRATVTVRKTGRSYARPQNAYDDHAHDCGAIEIEAAFAFPGGPDKPHVYTPPYFNNFSAVLTCW